MATPAMAAPGGCPSGQTCLWKDINYTTGGVDWIYFVYTNGANDLRNYQWSFNGTVNDNVSSWYNNGNTEASFIFDNLNFQGQLSYLPIKFGRDNLGNASDRATSAGFRFCLNNPTSAKCV
ncbi:hypothetical protein MTE01_32260 [Microbacterium testaceum]|uniref:Peptidase inhibitor family I36 n=1 Tax=Microbacterium testaceum TaxID=2033 RepID=A0A4Y3QQ22_MICTE|nr:hypothetical protein MTE01_32260 [Microbacterium testaceum]